MRTEASLGQKRPVQTHITNLHQVLVNVKTFPKERTNTQVKQTCTIKKKKGDIKEFIYNIHTQNICDKLLTNMEFQQ